MIPPFYTPDPRWAGEIARIAEALALVGADETNEEPAPQALELRKSHRVSAVHSSAAIEGNTLSREQVASLAEGKVVFAPPREVLEITGALTAYEAMDSFDPFAVTDFLRAHGLLTAGLVRESGQFRTVDVEIVNAAGEVLHTGSRHAKVPRLIAEALEWAATSDDHPLVVSSGLHFLIEHIHPFRDGNGRIGRLWQTLLLSRWNPLFAWMPTETIIRSRQRGYYQALQDSREPEIDAALFIEFMLEVIGETVSGYVSSLSSAGDVGATADRREVRP
ncbi:MAG: Fic family protein [Propionibacteriaceae bacterium]|jgi:Fic family protein|nr:Fic family protein [Propionibacteriaceae bacterium]